MEDEKRNKTKPKIQIINIDRTPFSRLEEEDHVAVIDEDSMDQDVNVFIVSSTHSVTSKGLPLTMVALSATIEPLTKTIGFVGGMTVHSDNIYNGGAWKSHYLTLKLDEKTRNHLDKLTSSVAAEFEDADLGASDNDPKAMTPITAYGGFINVTYTPTNIAYKFNEEGIEDGDEDFFQVGDVVRAWITIPSAKVVGGVIACKLYLREAQRIHRPSIKKRAR